MSAPQPRPAERVTDWRAQKAVLRAAMLAHNEAIRRGHDRDPRR